ncbi:hypothetical protein CHS0354_021175 [Potamilus streckersoni]|uniref:Uncharacterized protein n=1 Tax=Potamilus streckersoni TaxID=2493646 RepID=A0AAE0VR85_9BIVA|nr:hypothetical protein CHS0354_021175 [Potamilus streckersoni]
MKHSSSLPFLTNLRNLYKTNCEQERQQRKEKDSRRKIKNVFGQTTADIEEQQVTSTAIEYLRHLLRLHGGGLRCGCRFPKPNFNTRA